MKKILRISLFSSFLFAMTLGVAGCHFFGGNSQSHDTSKIQLTIGFWPEKSEKRDVAMYNVWKENFEKDNPEYEIVGAPYTYSIDTIGVKYETKSLPMVYQTWFTEPETLKNSGYIRDITSILDEFGWTNKMDDEMRETLTFDNKIYGVPRDGYGLGLLLNISILGDCGLLPEVSKDVYSLYNEDGSPAYPTTFEEIQEFSEVIVDSYASTKGMFICSANKQGGWQLSNYAWNYGAELEIKDTTTNKWKANLTDPGMVNALKWIQEMKQNDFLYQGISIVYDDWANSIGEKVAMAVVGSDILHIAQTTGGVDMSNLAFVPMPTGDGNHHYSLYGGTPYVFDKNTTDDQVRGILKFFDYIGRSPSTSEHNISAIREGYEVAKNKNQPIVPKIMPWKNNEFLTVAKQLEQEYVSVDMDYYPFFDTIQDNKHTEVPVAAQVMYEMLDEAIQEVLKNPDTANCEALLTTVNSRFQRQLDQLNG
ncbi:MAG: hypothetical protein IJQ67_04815 [Bacilli bacterium]|nr:hypothetical protein [Bacilli bacterium]